MILFLISLYIFHAPALEFLVILYKKWNELGKPYAASAATKTLQRYAVNLYDKLVYEYAW